MPPPLASDRAVVTHAVDGYGDLVAALALHACGAAAVIDRADATFLGVAGLSDFKRGIDALEGYPEAGWAFAAASWGRGIASEAISAVTGWADTAGIAETRCMIDHGNIASAKVAARCGYQPFAELAGERTVFRRPSRTRVRA